MIRSDMMALTVSWLVKLGCVLSIWIVMASNAPLVLQRWLNPVPQHVSVPERLATAEANLAVIQKQMDELQRTSYANAQRLAAVESKQDSMLKIALAIAIFMSTHVLQNWQRLRGRSRTRHTDNREEEGKT